MDDFIHKNCDLIAEYDSTEGTFPFDYCKYDIIDKIAAVQKQYKGCDLKSTLAEALQNAIRYQEPVIDSLQDLLNQMLEMSSSGGDFNITRTYFKEVGDLYKKHKGSLDLEYCPENRDKMIELNTKMVISVAKKYQGLGLSLQELISAGNLGLCAAWDKYDPSKSRFKDNILSAIQDLPDPFTQDELFQRIDPQLKYGNIRQKFLDYLGDQREGHSREALFQWIDKNIRNAKFSSICMMWIKAYILIEIDNASRLVKKPKSEIYKDKEENGTYKKENLLDLDQPIGGDTDTTFADTLCLEDDSDTTMDITERYDEYKEGLDKLLEGVRARDRAVLLKKFGIGLPRPLTSQELAESEGLSIARISQISLNVLAKMRANAAKYGIDGSSLFEAASHFK